MKIIQLTAENVKRLVAVEITPHGNLVQITGKNGQGKTSVLDSIWWAIAGAKHIQSAPIRKGANQAKIRLDLGEIIVTRTFKREKEGDGFTTKLEVVGAVKGSPQAMLDSLLDSLAFDPLAFARMDAKSQFDALKKYVPDVDFDKIAAANSIDFSTRAEKNKRAKEERVLADQIIIPPDKAPTVAIDESALVAQLADAGKHNSEIDIRAERRKRTAEDAERKKTQATQMREQAKTILENADVLEVEIVATMRSLETAPELPKPINVDELQEKIREAKRTNELVQLRAKKSLHEAAAQGYEILAKALTQKMEERDTQKQAAVAGAKLPVEALTFGNGLVLLNGVPFEQSSDADQLKASCALAMAGNPTLRVLRVRDGSLLDDESLALLAKMAEERDYQVWIERVGEGKVGFILEDGHLKQREEEERAELPGIEA